MVNNKLFVTNRWGNQSGQVAIFVALIFQVLFLFFAMIVNVGLLVHHKINLQNSVDLAAYYGAMKQAESMNAIGHINYQIRQSWKLLTWRYRQLGTAGTFNERVHPFSKRTKEITPGMDTEAISTNSSDKGFYDAPAFCVTYVPFRPMPKDENTCRKGHEDYSSVTLFRPPSITAPFLGLSVAIRQATMGLLSAATERCKTFGTINYLTLARFVTAYNIDQADKKLLMRHLALGLSEDPEDMRDLDGDSIKAGIEQTLKKNLSSPNRDSMQFKVFNSLGTAECGAQGVGQNEPPKWLSEIRVHPVFKYVDTECGQKIISVQRLLYDPPRHRNELDVQFQRQIEFFQQFVAGTAPEPYNFSMGYEKNPWCMAYVGVSATTKPRIPFAPLGDVELTARAYAKPFGGKIGPWYGSRWPKGPAGGNAQSEGDRIDDLLPVRARDLASLGDRQNDPTRAANYSKYPGDAFGLKSFLTLGQYGRAIFGLDPQWRNINYDSDKGAVDGINPRDNSDTPNFEHWNHVGMPYDNTNQGDLLAWDDKAGKLNPMRELETVAIAPDIFDITYYSIEPDYYNMYFKRIRDNYLKKKSGYNATPRSDVGSRVGNRDLEAFNVKDQIEVVKKISNMSQGPLRIKDKLTYIIEAAPQLLTSWVGKSLTDYSLDRDGFGKCQLPPLKEGPTSGDCIGPGRTGYSVKIIGDDYLKSPMPVGGEGVPADRILNPPPTEF